MLNSWQSESLLKYIADALSLFRVVDWLFKLQWEVFLIIFYLCFVLIFAVVIVFVCQAYQLKSKTTPFLGIIQFLRVASILF